MLRKDASRLRTAVLFSYTNYMLVIYYPRTVLHVFQALVPSTWKLLSPSSIRGTSGWAPLRWASSSQQIFPLPTLSLPVSMERMSGGIRLMFLIDIWKKYPRTVVLFLKPHILGFKEKSLQKKLMWPLQVPGPSICPLDSQKTRSKASPS